MPHERFPTTPINTDELDPSTAAPDEAASTETEPLTPESGSDLPDQEATPTVQPELGVDSEDTHNRQEDLEILGHSYQVRRTIHDKARNAKNNHELHKAERRNLRAKPKLWWREHKLKLLSAYDSSNKNSGKHTTTPAIST